MPRYRAALKTQLPDVDLSAVYVARARMLFLRQYSDIDCDVVTMIPEDHVQHLYYADLNAPYSELLQNYDTLDGDEVTKTYIYKTSYAIHAPNEYCAVLTYAVLIDHYKPSGPFALFTFIKDYHVQLDTIKQDMGDPANVLTYENPPMMFGPDPINIVRKRLRPSVPGIVYHYTIWKHAPIICRRGDKKQVLMYCDSNNNCCRPFKTVNQVIYEGPIVSVVDHTKKHVRFGLRLPWVNPDPTAIEHQKCYYDNESYGLEIFPLEICTDSHWSLVLVVDPDTIPEGFNMFWLDLDKVPKLFPERCYTTAYARPADAILHPHVVDDESYDELMDLISRPWTEGLGEGRSGCTIMTLHGSVIGSDTLSNDTVDDF